MTLVLAIKCVDRIIIAADGRSSDADTGEKRPDVQKAFKITDNSTVLVAGGGLVDDFGEYMDNLVQAIKQSGRTSVSDIAMSIKEAIDRRDWAGSIDEQEKSHLGAIVVGYDGSKALIFNILDNRDFGEVWTVAMGNWEERVDYMVNHVNKDPGNNSVKLGNRVAVEMLSKAMAANPIEVGPPFLIWHVFPSRIRELGSEEVTKLLNRYG